MLKDLDIKFLAYIREPIAAFIVDNTILGFHLTHQRVSWYYKTWDLLIQFFKDTRNYFEVPFSISDILENEAPISGDWDISVVGECNETDGCCLGISFEIKPNEDTNSVLFYDFKLEEHSIELEFEVSTYDAFLILSNFVVYHGQYGLFLGTVKLNDYYAMCLERNTFDYKKIKNRIDQTYYPYSHKPLLIYTCEYSRYIQDELRVGRITPNKILNIGGVELLFLLRTEDTVQKFLIESIDKILSFDEKNDEPHYTAALTTLLYKFREFSYFDRILFDDKQRYSRYPSDLRTIRKKLKVPFPSPGERWFKWDKD